MPQDGDTVFAVSTGTRKMPADRPLALWQIGHLAAETLARAVTRGVYEATALDGDPKPAWRDVFSREARG